MKAGGQGDRYAIRITGNETYLFFERTTADTGAIIGRWFAGKRINKGMLYLLLKMIVEKSLLKDTNGVMYDSYWKFLDKCGKCDYNCYKYIKSPAGIPDGGDGGSLP